MTEMTVLTIPGFIIGGEPGFKHCFEKRSRKHHPEEQDGGGITVPGAERE